MTDDKYDISAGQTFDENTVERLLRAAGQRRPIPEPIKEAWTQTFRSELNKTLARRQRQRRVVLGSFCAGIVVLAFLLVLPFRQPIQTQPPIARVVSISGIGKAFTEAGSLVRLDTGNILTSGSTIETIDNTQLALDYAGADIRLDQLTRVRLHAEKIELLAGKIYIDSDDRAPAVTRSSPIIIDTQFGEIRDIGTQFTVSSDAESVIARVREGAIRATVGNRKYTAYAGAVVARKLSIFDVENVQITDTRKRGQAWDWILNVAPAFAIEGRTAYEFLEWSARQTGLNLVFADRRTELNARMTILHGNISALSPDQAINTVLATTRLISERLDEDTLKITLSVQ